MLFLEKSPNLSELWQFFNTLVHFLQTYLVAYIIVKRTIIVESTIKWAHEKPIPLYPSNSHATRACDGEGRSDRCKSVQIIIGFTIMGYFCTANC